MSDTWVLKPFNAYYNSPEIIACCQSVSTEWSTRHQLTSGTSRQLWLSRDTSRDFV